MGAFLDIGRAKQGRPTHFWILWCLILLISAFLRFSNPDWDQGVAAHPDERFLLGVAYDTPIYGSPCKIAPEFPYGHLPVTVISLMMALAPQADPLYSSRLLSSLGGVLLVVLTGCCGLRLTRSQGGGLLAAFLAAFCPFFVQQAHFYTADPWAAIFGTLALLLGMREKWFWSGSFVGLAVACKASSAWIGVSLIVAMMIVTHPRRWIRSGSHYLFGGLIAIFFGSPWLILTPFRCWRGPLVQAQLAAGWFVFPYTQQYVRTSPWVYPLKQMFLWGIGPAATLAGAVTLSRSFAVWRQMRRSYKLALVATILFIAATAGLYVKYPRYLLPIYPVWMGLAAKGLVDLHQSFHRGLQRLGSFVLILLAVLITSALGIAQASVYRGFHPWVEASRWIYENVPEGSTIAVESWDHPLPVPLPSGDPSRYQQVTVPVLDGTQASDEDAETFELFRDAEVVVLASRRNYGVVIRQPERFDTAYHWYETLFRERRVSIFSRCPVIGGLALTDDPLRDLLSRGDSDVSRYCETEWVLRLPRLDESFRVYDAPITIILVKDD